MGDLRAISGPSGEVSGRVILRSILVNSEVILGPFLDPSQETSSNTLELPSFGRR